MFPLTELLSHAELNRRRPRTEHVEARRAARQTRYGNLTLFPIVERGEPIAEDDGIIEEPRVVASISNVSSTGVGLILAEELPSGMEFDCQWPQGEFPVPLRFEVVHSQPISAGMYRVGARLLAGILPEEAMTTEFIHREPVAPANYELTLTAPIDSEAPAVERTAPEAPVTPISENGENQSIPFPKTSPMVFSGGVLQFEPEKPQSRMNLVPAPAGTFRTSHAFGFDKTEKLDGVTTCGWERSIEVRRDGDRLWIYIHSPGKKNGWGIFVDPDAFEAAVNRVQEGSRSPFISTLAA